MRKHYSQVYTARPWRLIWLILALSAVSGCQSFRYQTLLEKNVLHSEFQQSTPYIHRVFQPVGNADDGGELHIYIKGDGRPWRGRYFVAPDPTPEYALMLEAMLRDPVRRVYLGRPCYFHTDDPACNANDWTMARYSDTVVRSMTRIVDELAGETQELWLIGHSGGGALALLIGRRLNRPVNVLTVAANLDHPAWTDFHGYTPLKDSLNPADEIGRNPQLREMHWYGREDNNVLPDWTLAYCRRQAVECRETNAAHATGWLPRWEEVLSEARAYFSED